jgi:tetratricopeptide (TPR) repeat protein
MTTHQDQDKRSIHEGDRALELFTNRSEVSRLFLTQLHEPGPNNPVLFFHGDGGNGKSLLLKFLRQKCCKLLFPQDWQQIRDLTAVEMFEFVKTLQAGQYLHIPTVKHNFEQRIGDDRPQDPFYGLLSLRHKLISAAHEHNYRLRFPLYDFACIWYQYRRGRSPEEIKAMFPFHETLGFVTSLIDITTKTPITGITRAIFNLLAKDVTTQLAHNMNLQVARWGIADEQIEEIIRKDPDTELIHDLPRFLGEDLQQGLQQPNAPKRIVLFFDTHESFWGDQRNLSNALFFARDEWVRQLVRHLPLEAGVMVVVAGREPPRWAEASTIPPTDVPSKRIVPIYVGYLSELDAVEYLNRVAISEPSLQQQLILYASVQPAEVHPLYLGLCADVVLQARTQKIDLTAADFTTLPDIRSRSKALMERILKYVNQEICYAVNALIACRTFDYKLYQRLGEELGFSATRPAFNFLTQFSFVWQAEQRGRGWYQIHRLLRRLADNQQETTQAAHAVLEAYYRDREEIAESIYHLNRLHQQQGVAAWLAAFEQALQLGRYEDCRILLEIRNELLIPHELSQGQVAYIEGEYFAQLARYPEAEAKYSEAITAFDQILSNSKPDLMALTQKGCVVKSLGDLQTKRSHYHQALNSYQQAIEMYNQALEQAQQLLPQSPLSHELLNSRGKAQRSLGELYAKQTNYAQAMISYQAAIATFDLVLQAVPTNLSASNNKGLTLNNLGKLYDNREEFTLALENYQQAIATYDQILQHTPTEIKALGNRALTLRNLGDLQCKQSLEQLALLSYQQAIRGYDQALQIAPHETKLLSNKGVALQSLGKLQVEQGQIRIASEHFQQAIAVYDRLLELAPSSIAALNNKGMVLRQLGELHDNLSQSELAVSYYRQAVGIYNEALNWSPSNINALKNKGNVLFNLGNCFKTQSQIDQTLEYYQQAIELYDQVLQLAPNDQDVQNSRALVQQSLFEIKRAAVAPVDYH